MKNHVVTISVKADAAGQDLGVQEATITLGVNDIPTIELLCAPSKDKPTPLEPKVSKPTIAEFVDLYRDLANKAEGLSEPGNVTIDIKDAEGRADSISLKNWVLAGAGLSGIGSTNAPYLSVILQHPICKLTKVGAIYEEPEEDPSIVLNMVSAEGSNLLDIMDIVYGFFREDMTYYPAAEGAQAFRKQLGFGEFDPNEYLEFNGDSGIFLGGDEGEIDAAMSMAMGRLVLPSSGGSSTWDTLVSASGSLLLSITQDQDRNFMTDKLVLEPTQPWKDVSITLNEDECFRTDVPGMDPFKIMGVMCRRLGPFNNINGGESTYNNGNDNDEDPVAEFFYSPIEKPSVADGRIIMTDYPDMLDSAFRRAAPHGDDIPGGETDLDEERKELFDLELQRYCEAVYDCTAASMVRAKAQMVLWFRDSGGNLILPGNTCVFKAKGEKGMKDIYYGYIQQVVHHLSTSGGCSTSISMSHVRPEASFYVGGKVAIPIGKKNAAYM